MEVWFFIFGFAALVYAVYVFERNDKTAYLKFCGDIKEVQGLLKNLESIAGENQFLMNGLSKRVAECEKSCEEMQTHQAKARASIISLREKLSMKNTTIKMPTGPFAVEIYQSPKPIYKNGGAGGTKHKPLGRGMKAVLRDQ